MTVLIRESFMSRSPHSDPSDMPPSTPVLRHSLREGRLSGTVKLVQELTDEDRRAMFRLMATYFANIRRQRFDADLAEKEWVILLYEVDRGELQGFSTLMRLDEEIDGEPVTAFFSGDTLISRRFWGETVLPRLWGRLVFALAAGIIGRKVYWFLICSGYKTYRFLPVFFRTFHPCREHPCPARVRRIMDILASRKFPNEYDAEKGVVSFREATPLKAGVAEVTERRLKDPHVSFFHGVNPGHIHGDELVCLAEIDYRNLTPAGKRMIGLNCGDKR
jgi:hypothetical protein